MGTRPRLTRNILTVAALAAGLGLVGASELHARGGGGGSGTGAPSGVGAGGGRSAGKAPSGGSGAPSTGGNPSAGRSGKAQRSGAGDEGKAENAAERKKVADEAAGRCARTQYQRYATGRNAAASAPDTSGK